jgi:GAF domain-containing protein
MASPSPAPSVRPETLDETIRRLTAELHEACEQRAATTEVLEIINSSPGELTLVFDAMLEKAIRLCGGDRGVLWRIDGQRGHPAAARGLSAEFIALLRERGESGTDPPLQQVISGERVIEFPDTAESELYRSGDPLGLAAVEADVRSLIWVALVKEDVPVGAFAIGRPQVGRFSSNHIALLQNFAAQAVIAMENARLLTETREALEQQTASAEVLGVINSSPGDLAPVFDAMLEKAHTLCGADHGILAVADREYFRAVATRGNPEALEELVRQPFLPTHDFYQRLLQGENFVQIADLTDAKFSSDHPIYRTAVDIAGVRTLLMVPLRKDGALLGFFTANRREVRPFTDKQIALLQNFAAQAVIAMENARLLIETREALEQQTATAEVLGVINSAPGDPAPVFDAMLEKATWLCEAPFGLLRTWDGERFHLAAARGDPKFTEWAWNYGPFVPDDSDSPLGRIVSGEEVVARFADAPGEEAHSIFPSFRVLVEASGMRSAVTVALRKDDVLLGTITVYREEVRPFSDKQIALLQNFAAQAVIAMENARLITETREALEQQTATAEVLQVINSSPGDLAPVFEAILEKAIQLCGAAFGGLVLRYGQQVRHVALHAEPRVAEYLRELGPLRVDPDNPIAQSMRQGRVVQFADVMAEDCQRNFSPETRRLHEIAGVRTLLRVPLRKNEELLGSITAFRQEVRPFSDKQITLLQNFAAQAVIAMENARLITETREALEQQTATAEVLQVINSSPGDLGPVFDAMLEKATRLCEAAHGNFLTYDGEVFHTAAVRGEPRFAEYRRQQDPLRPAENSQIARLAQGGGTLHRVDAREDEAYHDDPAFRQNVDGLGIRTSLTVPLRKGGVLLGAVRVYRQEVRPFTDKQIALVENFAAQAVIAMENARLLTETREALEQQTATAEVLQVINSSPGDLAPVFDAILEKAMRLCGIVFGSLQLQDGGKFRAVAVRGLADSLVELLRQPLDPNPGSPPFRLINGERIVHIADMVELAGDRTDDLRARAAAEHGFRTALFVPLRKDAELLGYLVAFRREVRPYSEKEIALLENFAAQAVIAMENARLLTETREALEQQTATAEVLQVINTSPGDLAPVFDAMLEKATRLCEATFGIMQTYDGERFEPAALQQVPAALVEWQERTPLVFGPGTAPARIVSGENLVHTVDLMATEAYQRGDPSRRALVDLGGARSHLIVALRKDGALLGTLAVYRQEVRPFSDKQIALLQNFAAQAVIAMENARLITETREALEQQTATAEVLQVINSSPGDLAPVFDAMLERAMRLCEAAFGTLWTYDGDRFRSVAQRGVPRPYADYLVHNAPAASAGTGRARILRGERFVHVKDLRDEEPYPAGDPHRRAVVDLGGARTGLIVPLVKDDAVIGFVMIYRQQVRPFTDKQIALLQNFAAQAVIAIENVRLLTETREALEQQTATAEVLQVINSSPGDLTPMFDAILEKAHQLCGAAFGALNIYDGDKLRAVAVRGLVRPFAERVQSGFIPSHTHPASTLQAGAPFVQIPDVAEVNDPWVRAAFEAGGLRTVLFIPLSQRDRLLGNIVAARPEVRPFTDKQIALLQNFAAQAVIAMENARLITETREALEQQTATAEVLQVINSSPGDLAPVFDAMLDKALQLCLADYGVLWIRDGDVIRAGAIRGASEEFVDFLLRERAPVDADMLIARAVRERSVIHLRDAKDSEPYRRGVPLAVFSADRAGIRTILMVPLSKEDDGLGLLTIYRREVRLFSEKEIALVQNFAAQAVIAIENARLITETREALEQQTATAEVLQVINSSPGDLTPVFDAILEKAHSLCNAPCGSLQIVDGEQFRAVATRGLTEAYAAILRRGVRPHGLDPKAIVQFDFAERLAQDPGNENARVAVEIEKLRTVLFVPLLKEGVLIGRIAAGRQEVRPFSDKQIALLQNFAAQAVIAMENARLLTETREALEQQTATAEVLQVINSSPGDLAPVFDAMLDKAMHLCGAAFGNLMTYHGGDFHFVAARGHAKFEAWLRQAGPLYPAPGTTMGRIVAGESVAQVADMTDDEVYRRGVPIRRALVEIGGFRTLLTVALRKEDALLGLLNVYRREVRPFTDKQIALSQNFAAQAVIAMENARLITETREALEQQTATAEVLQVINSHPAISHRCSMRCWKERCASATAELAISGPLTASAHGSRGLRGSLRK